MVHMCVCVRVCVRVCLLADGREVGGDLLPLVGVRVGVLWC